MQFLAKLRHEAARVDGDGVGHRHTALVRRIDVFEVEALRCLGDEERIPRNRVLGVLAVLRYDAGLLECCGRDGVAVGFHARDVRGNQVS